MEFTAFGGPSTSNCCIYEKPQQQLSRFTTVAIYFGATTTDASVEESEDVPAKEEVAAENEGEVPSDNEDQSAPNEENGTKSETKVL